MNYFYGDSTPFPLDESFLETLDAVTKTSVQMLLAHQRALEATREIERASDQADNECQWLSARSTELLEQLSRSSDASSSPVLHQESGRLMNAVETTVRQGCQRIIERRDARTAELMKRVAVQRKEVEQVLRNLLATAVLPDSTWDICWSASECCATAKATVQAPCGIRGLFGIDIPSSMLWAGPVQVQSLRPESLAVRLPRISRVRRRLTERNLDIAKYFITEARTSPGECRLRLVRKLREPHCGFDITIIPGEVTVQLLGDGHEPVCVNADVSAKLRRLAEAVERGMEKLVALRRTVIDVMANDASLAGMEDVTEIVKLLIASVAHYANEVAARSLVAGELSLKRELSDRRREVVFLPLDQLLAQVRLLPPELSELFQLLGPSLYEEITARQSVEQAERCVPTVPPQQSAEDVERIVQAPAPQLSGETAECLVRATTQRHSIVAEDNPQVSSDVPAVSGTVSVSLGNAKLHAFVG